MKVQVHRISAFCEGPLQGNPAAVCLGSEGASKAAMQALAAQIGYSETAFPVKEGKAYKLRWFTPTVEVKLCGHATLAAAWLLWDLKLASSQDAVQFKTASGILKAVKKGDTVELDFPAAKFEHAELPPALSAMGDRVVACGTYNEDWLVEMRSQEDVLAIDVDAPSLAEVETRGIAFTARAEKQPFDIVSRFFAPRHGIPEDPVTGSAHCGLGPYWAAKLNKEEIYAWQASPRGGALRLSFNQDRVLLAGQARRMAKVENFNV